MLLFWANSCRRFCTLRCFFAGFVYGSHRFPMGDSALGIEAEEQRKKAQEAFAKIRAARKALE